MADVIKDFLTLGGASAVEDQNAAQQAAFAQQQGIIGGNIDAWAAMLGLIRAPAQQAGVKPGSGISVDTSGSTPIVRGAEGPEGTFNIGGFRGARQPVTFTQAAGGNTAVGDPFIPGQSGQPGQGGPPPNIISLGGRDFIAGDGGGIEGTRNRLQQEFFDPQGSSISRQIAALQRQLQSSATSRGRTADTGALRIAGEVGLGGARRNAAQRADQRISSVLGQINNLALGIAGAVPVNLPEPSTAGAFGSVAIPLGISAATGGYGGLGGFGGAQTITTGQPGTGPFGGGAATDRTVTDQNELLRLLVGS